MIFYMQQESDKTLDFEIAFSSLTKLYVVCYTIACALYNVR